VVRDQAAEEERVDPGGSGAAPSTAARLGTMPTGGATPSGLSQQRLVARGGE